MQAKDRLAKGALGVSVHDVKDARARPVWKRPWCAKAHRERLGVCDAPPEPRASPDYQKPEALPAELLELSNSKQMHSDPSNARLTARVLRAITLDDLASSIPIGRGRRSMSRETESNFTPKRSKSSADRATAPGSLRRRFAIVRGNRATSFSPGTSCPPWETRMAMRSSEILGPEIPMKQRTTL